MTKKVGGINLEEYGKKVAEAAAKGAVKGASGVSGDKQKAAEAAKKAVENLDI